MCGRGSVTRLVVLVCLNLVLATLLFAHGEGPPAPPVPPAPPAPPPEAPQTDVRRVYPCRWSWLHWWEANRDEYFEILRQSHPQKVSQTALDTVRRQAVEALLAGLKDEAWQGRAYSALALGQMGCKEQLATLEAMIKDPDENVQVFSILAIGLLNTPESEGFLDHLTPASNLQSEATLCALGFFDGLSPESIGALQRASQSSDPGFATIAMMSLRQFPNSDVASVQQALRSSPSAWVASEAILTLGRSGKAQYAADLATILLQQLKPADCVAWTQLLEQHQRVLAIAAFGQANRAEYEKVYGEYEKRGADWNKNAPNLNQDYQKTLDAWYKTQPAPAVSPVTPSAKPTPLPKRPAGPTSAKIQPMKTESMIRVVVGVQQIYMARLQASAAQALGNIDSPISRQVLLKCLGSPDNGYNELYKEFALISLGKLGDPAAMPAIMDILRPTLPNRQHKTKAKLQSPLRGFAAIALGLYGRPVATAQGPEDRPDYAKACALMADRMADGAEEMEVRTACALALGLTGRSENLRYLQPASETVKAGDDLLVGYTILGRGMLGDRNILEPARKYLTVANDKSDMAGILGRRSAVLGLGLSGAEETIPVILSCWDLSHYPNRESVLALSMAQAYNATTPLVKLMKESKNPWERAFGAECLGEIFCQGRPARLSRLIAGCNYMLKNDRVNRYQVLANHFLFEYLIPSFGPYWL